MGLFSKSKPRKQWYGGSEEAYKADQQRTASGIANAEATSNRGVQASQSAANRTTDQYRGLNAKLDRFGDRQKQEAQQADRGFAGTMGNYDRGRAGVISNANRLEQGAANMQRDYRQTADRQFAINQDNNQRAALALGGRGGAAGLRTAMATSSNANAQAANQAEIVRANELNQMIGMQQNAYAQAANIRAGQGAQDQAAAQQYAARQQNAYANQGAAYGQIAGNVGNQAQVQQGAAQLAAGQGLAREGLYHGEATDRENAQLNAAREREQGRVADNNNKIARAFNPFG